MITLDLTKKETLTQEEYNVLVLSNPDFVNEYLLKNEYLGTYLNLNAYSETEHHEFTQRKESGLF